MVDAAELFEFGYGRTPAVLIALVPALLNVGLVAYVLRYVKRNALTYTFLLFVGALTVWQLSEALVRMAETPTTALFWADVLSFGALLIAPVGMHFALLFTERRRLASNPAILAVLYVPALFYEVLSRAGLNEPTLTYREPWGFIPEQPTPLLNQLLGVWVAGLALAMLAVLFQYAWSLPKQHPHRRQGFLVAGGFAVPTVGGTFLQVVMPSFLGMEPIPIASTLTTVFSVATVVALRRHRFLQTETLEERLKATQDALSRRGEQLAEAQMIAHLGSWEWDLTSGHVSWSDEMYRIYGHEPGAFPVTFERAMDGVFEEDAARIRRETESFIRQTAETGPRGQHEFRVPPTNYRIRRPNGSVRSLRGEGRILTDRHGIPARLVGTVQDVTEQRVSEQRALEMDQLRRMSDFKTRFLNAAAHELNTPLTPITIQLHLLKRAMYDGRPAEARKSTEILDRNIRRMTALVQDLLDAARLQAGRLPLRIRGTDLAIVLADAVETFAPVGAQTGVAFTAEVERDLWAKADATRVRQVVDNLLTNAFKFTPAGGSVHMSARRADGKIRVRVQDSGVGLEPHQLARLFQPFTQLHDAADQARGTGLGLYISHGIVDRHGGRIWAESDGPDRGATFSFAIPEDARGVASEAAPDESASVSTRVR